jgi:hypothetical protein
MIHRDILFETDRFNVSEVKEHFINPCCFGEDLAEWLRQELIKREITASAPGQEDWGWYLFVEPGTERYFLGVGGYRKEGTMGTNDGEWRIMVEKKRSLWDKLQGKNKIIAADPILSTIEDILREQADIRNVSHEFSSL